MNQLKKITFPSEFKIDLLMMADEILFLSLVQENESVKQIADNVEDIDAFLSNLSEFILKLKSKRDSLKLIVGAEIVESGFISMDNIALRNHKVVIRRAKELKKLLEKKTLSSTVPEQGESSVRPPKTFAKFYALYHWLKIAMATAIPFSKNEDGKYIRADIESFAKQNYPECSPQGFYRSFKDIDITNRTAIANTFGRGYKEKLIKLSKNDSKLIIYLKNYPN